MAYNWNVLIGCLSEDGWMFVRSFVRSFIVDMMITRLFDRFGRIRAIVLYFEIVLLHVCMCWMCVCVITWCSSAECWFWSIGWELREHYNKVQNEWDAQIHTHTRITIRYTYTVKESSVYIAGEGRRNNECK